MTRLVTNEIFHDFLKCKYKAFLDLTFETIKPSEFEKIQKTITSEYKFNSQNALTHKKRILKNREKLFCFLNYDAVPWNNNYAEHAIKSFVYLRKIIGGSSTSLGLKNYLVLLSICETLRMKNVSFLEFLISGSTDINEFFKK